MYSVHCELFRLCPRQLWALAHHWQEHHSSFPLEKLPVSQGWNANGMLSFPSWGGEHETREDQLGSPEN